MIDTSIVITNFNNGKYIGRCLRSCLKQSMPNNQYEIIVVDDASTDSSKDIIDTFGDLVKPVYLKENVGVAGASNEGIRKALGAYIVRVDSDDYINEHLLLFLSEIMTANKEIGFVYPDYIYVDADENKIEVKKIETLEDLYRHGAGVMFRKSYLEAIGLYDKEFKNAEDQDLLMRYLKNYDGYHLKAPLYRYRKHGESLTADEDERKPYEQKAETKNTNNS